MRRKMDGLWKFFHDTGELKEDVSFKDNKENGPYKKYYQNGNIETEGQYADGEESGYWKSYFESGKLKEEVENFAAGWEDGMVYVYNEQGDTIKKIRYKNGRVDSYKEFNQPVN